MTTNAEMKEKLLFVCNKIDEVLKQNHEMKTKEIQIKSQEENIIDNSPNYIGRINSLKTQMELLQKNLEEIYNIDKVNQLESEIKEKEQILKTLKNEKKLLNQAVKEQNKGINEYITKFDSTKDIQELTEDFNTNLNLQIKSERNKNSQNEQIIQNLKKMSKLSHQKRVDHLLEYAHQKNERKSPEKYLLSKLDEGYGKKGYKLNYFNIELNPGEIGLGQEQKYNFKNRNIKFGNTNKLIKRGVLRWHTHL